MPDSAELDLLLSTVALRFLSFYSFEPFDVCVCVFFNYMFLNFEYLILF